MTLSIAKQKRPIFALLGLMVASLAILPLLPPIAQDPSYHQFADQRMLLGIPNFWNVISNLPFVVVGAIGLWQFGRERASFVLFLVIFLTGFGSAYYHGDPNNDTLFWDRLPLALTFMAILAVAVEERVSAKTGAVLLWPLLALAIFSLLLWRWTGDLRLYGWVQFSPASHCRSYSLRVRQDIPAPLTGLSPRHLMHSPNCSNCTIMQSIRLDSS
jgi:hypothetical protein